MSNGFEIPRNPVELALGTEQSMEVSFDMSRQDEQVVAQLDFVAEGLGFLDQRYFLRANTGFQVPLSFDRDQPVTMTQFDTGVTAEATLATYAKLHIGQIIGFGAVRALCLCFPEGIVLNNFTAIPEGHALFVPVLAVSEISQAA